MKIGVRLFWLVVIMSIAILIVSLTGMMGIRNGMIGLKNVYKGGTDSIHSLNKLATIYRMEIIDAATQVQSGSLTPEYVRQKIASARQNIAKTWLEYKSTDAKEEDVAEANKLKGMMDAAYPLLLELERLLTNYNKETYQEFMLQEIFPSLNPLIAQVAQVIESHANSTLQDYQAAVAKVTMNYELTIIATILGILVSSLVAYLIVKSITKPLGIAVSAANRLALGDASVEISVTSQDEVGQLLQAMQSMVNKLRHVISGIQDEVDVLSSSAKEIMKSVSEASESTAETAAAVTETTTTVEELKQTAHISAEKAQDVLNAAENSQHVVKNSEASLQATIKDMGEIEDKMRVITDSIIELSKHGLAIGEIIDTVNDLAKQSHLLAVNAAIEAAKAGEQGKSFGVVAQEIRLLA
jgi:methyl-accepting chemotaxis protein